MAKGQWEKSLKFNPDCFGLEAKRQDMNCFGLDYELHKNRECVHLIHHCPLSVWLSTLQKVGWMRKIVNEFGCWDHWRQKLGTFRVLLLETDLTRWCKWKWILNIPIWLKGLHFQPWFPFPEYDSSQNGQNWKCMCLLFCWYLTFTGHRKTGIKYSPLLAHLI